MMGAVSARVASNRKFLPLLSTIALFLVMYLAGYLAFPAMQNPQSFFSLFNSAPFLMVTVVGEAFVIISGGIDLSVSGILALSTVVAASLVNMGWNVWVVFAVVLLMGVAFGFAMGWFITYLKVQPFIATLAGLWLGRGLCYVISDAEVRIHDATYTTLDQTKILIPGLANPSTRKGDYITYLVVAALVVVVAGLLVLHLTRFGRTVYAMGGGNGANEASSRLMGLPVNRTKVSVYMVSGFCSALAGILYSIYVGSGHGTHGTGFELTTIAAVVIGGVALTGGEGYLIGAVFGALVTALIQILIQYNGQLSSYWVYIFVGALMLLFIGIQSIVVAWNEAAIGRARAGGHARRKIAIPWYKTTMARLGIVAVVVIVVGAFSVNVVAPFVFPKQAVSTCKPAPMRPDQDNALIQAGAVVVYERNGGTSCVDQLYAIYSDGKITSDYGNNNTKQSQISVAQVNTLLGQINDLGFFTDNFYTTYHTPCGACFRYSTTVKFNGQTKTVDAVDGGTDAPAAYWPMTGHLSAILYPGGQ
jgi:Ribose/xylose/arabinose/galactoside ABC-type transport systems, permease components